MNADTAYHQLPIPDWLGLACPQCQYPLRGLPTHRCPECGLSLDMEELTKPTFVPLRPPTITSDTRPVPDLGLECRSCGYPLRGLTSDRCPECGQAFELDDFVPDGAWPALLCNDASITETLVISLHHEGLPVMLDGDQKSIDWAMIIYSGARYATVRVRRDYYLDALQYLRTEREPTASWTCPQCQSKVPGHFDICWNCQAERP